MNIIISIKPKFANLILKGNKKIEFRRKFLESNDIYKYCYIYSSSPEKRIIGFFKINKIIKEKLDYLWNNYNSISGINKSDFERYFKDLELGYAILVEDLIKFKTPINPNILFPNFKAPQNFCIIKKVFCYLCDYYQNFNMSFYCTIHNEMKKINTNENDKGIICEYWKINNHYSLLNIKEVSILSNSEGKIILKENPNFRKIINISYEKNCICENNKFNCLSAKDWFKSQIPIKSFSYNNKDYNNKEIHPAIFPLELVKDIVSIYTHKGELVVDPFCGTSTTLMACKELDRNCIGIDLKKEYILLWKERSRNKTLLSNSLQIAINDDARNLKYYFNNKIISLIVTSPPYANLLDRERTNRAKRNNINDYLGVNQQYSHDENDLGILEPNKFIIELENIFKDIIPFIEDNGRIVIITNDFKTPEKLISLHSLIINSFQKIGLILKNINIWDKRNNSQIGIMGYPSNYISHNSLFEYIIEFIKNDSEIK